MKNSQPWWNKERPKMPEIAFPEMAQGINRTTSGLWDKRTRCHHIPLGKAGALQSSCSSRWGLAHSCGIFLLLPPAVHRLFCFCCALHLRLWDEGKRTSLSVPAWGGLFCCQQSLRIHFETVSNGKIQSLWRAMVVKPKLPEGGSTPVVFSPGAGSWSIWTGLLEQGYPWSLADTA